MSATLQNFGHRLIAEKRKLGTLVVLLVLAALLWGRLLIPAGPQRATGQQAVDARAPQPDGTEAAESVGEPIPEPPESVVVRVRLDRQVQRDPFRIRRDHYEPTQPEQAEEAEEAKKADESEQPDPEAERRQRMRQQRNAVRAEAEQLTLQSTLIAQQPQAIINGQPLTPGQTIRGFRLLEVRSRQVRLVKQGVEITLRIRSD